MNYKEITELIKLLNRTNLSEFKLKDKDFEITIRTDNFRGKNAQYVQAGGAPMVQMPIPPVAAPVSAISQNDNSNANKPPAAKDGDSTVGLVEIKSPIVGTFYRSSSPDKPALAKVGDKISKGQCVCIIEAMKLFNEIESEVSGTIVKVLVDDAAPVEYDQVLFLVDPS